MYRKQIAIHGPAVLGAFVALSVVAIALSTAAQWLWWALGTSVLGSPVTLRWLFLAYAAFWAWHHKEWAVQLLDRVDQSQAATVRKALHELRDADKVRDKLRVIKGLMADAKQRRDTRRKEKKLERVVAEQEG